MLELVSRENSSQSWGYAMKLTRQTDLYYRNAIVRHGQDSNGGRVVGVLNWLDLQAVEALHCQT